ncbi:hypothetical protein EIM44_04900 [Bibersteinia trehalosi]|uniref:Uncharacterized protein n=1 Tax=Bibersteinia trehalosi TaxID=47735 RepID=A0A426FJ87_BIBTR|nr:hypothetical protein EIM44_04900 [Bibersteinia trehalosi]
MAVLNRAYLASEINAERKNLQILHFLLGANQLARTKQKIFRQFMQHHDRFCELVRLQQQGTM